MKDIEDVGSKWLRRIGWAMLIIAIGLLVFFLTRALSSWFSKFQRAYEKSMEEGARPVIIQPLVLRQAQDEGGRPRVG